MSREEQTIRTGLGVLTESAPSAPGFDEIVDQATRHRPRVSSYVIAAALLVVSLLTVTTLFSGGLRLAYAMEPGLDVQYSVTAETSIEGETIPPSETLPGPAHLGFRIDDSADGQITVEISYRPPAGCDTCFEPVTFTQTATSTGEIIAVEGLPDSAEIPEFAIPTPIPHAGAKGGFPLFLGPPLPEENIGVGESWNTNQDGVDGTHRLVDETEIAGHQVVVIESSYSFDLTDSRGVDSTIDASTTVWFDPTDGVVVRAQLLRTHAALNKTTQIEFQLQD